MGINEELTAVEKRINALSRKVSINQFKWNYMFWNSLVKDGEEPLASRKEFFFKLKAEDENMIIPQKINVMLLEELSEILKKENISYWLDFGTLLGAVRHKGFVPWDDDIDIAVMRYDFDRLVKAVEKSKYFRLWNNYIVDTQCCRVVRFMSSKYAIPNFIDIFIYDRCDSVSDETWEKYRKYKGEFSEAIRAYDFHHVNEDIPYKGDRLYSLAVTQKDEVEYLDNMVKEKSQLILNSENGNDNGIIWGIDNFSFFPRKKCIFSHDDIFPLKYVEFEGGVYPAPAKTDDILADKYGNIYTLPNDMMSHHHFRIDDEMMMSYKKIIEKGNFK